MRTEDITYSVGGKTMTGYLADGAKGWPAPGVLVRLQGGGLAGHEKERAHRLAELGYVGFASDRYGDPPVDTRPVRRDVWLRLPRGILR